MNKILSFLYKHLKVVVPIVIFVPCLIVCGSLMLSSIVSYRSYEKQYEDQIFDIKMSSPLVPSEIYIDNNFVAYDKDGNVTNTKSNYTDVTTILADDVKASASAVVKTTDEADKLGKYVGGLNIGGGEITATVTLTHNAYSDIVIYLASSMQSETGEYIWGTNELFKQISITINDVSISGSGVNLNVTNPYSTSETDWQCLVLRNQFLVEGENKIVITGDSENSYYDAFKVMPSFRNITVFSDDAFNKTTQNIKVNLYGEKASAIEITKMPTTTTYMTGEFFDETGMVVTATIGENKIELKKGQYTYDVDVLTEETNGITIKYDEVEAIVPITVVSSSQKVVDYCFDEDTLMWSKQVHYDTSKFVSETDSNLNANEDDYITNLKGEFYTATLKANAEAGGYAVLSVKFSATATFNFSDEFAIFVNSTKCSCSSRVQKAVNGNFTEYKIGTVRLNKGLNFVTFVHYNKATATDVKFDCITLSSTVKVTKAEAVTDSLIEAEAGNATTNTPKYADNTQNEPSGGHAIGGLSASQTGGVKFTLNVTKGGRYAVYIVVGLHNGTFDLNGYTVYVNGKACEINNINVPASTGGSSISYADWHEMCLGVFNLEEGENTFEVAKLDVGTNTSNIDCFTFYGEGSVTIA